MSTIYSYLIIHSANEKYAPPDSNSFEYDINPLFFPGKFYESECK